MGETITGKDTVMMVLIKPFSLTFTEPILFLFLLNLYIALIYRLLNIWFGSFAIVFTGIYGFNLSEEGLSFLGILVGGFVAIGPFFLYLKYIQELQFDENGNIKPEERLPPAFIGGFCITI
jgi:MFS transporter, DHA1 family, multidrug resistance protein